MKVIVFAMALFVFLSSSVQAQNTKGDKPATQKSIFRIPKLKSKSKGVDKAYLGDVSGRKRIRTKNKSSAVRAAQTKPLPFANRRPSNDKAYVPRGGAKVRIRSRTAELSRNNVYPNFGKFVSNPSRHPKDNQHAYSNRRALSKASSLGTKREPPGRKKIIVARSASRSFVTRGRKNVYWGKFRKGEKAITTDISGRTLRAKNFHTPGLGVIPVQEVYKKKKKYGDQSYKGPYTGGYVTTPKTTKAWRGDVSGHAIRTRPPKVSQQAGRMFEPRKLSISNRKKPSKPLPGSGLASHPSKGISNRAIQGKAPGIGANLIVRALGKYRGKKRPPGGTSKSKGFNNGGQPILGKAPNFRAKKIDVFQGLQRGRTKVFDLAGANFSGDIKTKRAAKGGGSISGQGRNNSGQPINVKGPGIGGRFVDTYQGSIRGRKSFSTYGYAFSGNLKSNRPAKGGGSVSGKMRNNSGQPIVVKGPGIGGRFLDTYQGSIRGRKTFSTYGYAFSGDTKSKRPLKGGGSVSGKLWNNSGQAIDVRGPGIGGRFVDIYQGNIKARRPSKGGGSISGKVWNNSGQPIVGKGSGVGGGYDIYRGDIKYWKEPKGGGSISGKLWNNSNKPIAVKPPAGVQAKYVDIYQGLHRGHKPVKGGGSVSGKLWNNKEQPIEGKAFSPASMKVSVFTGDKKVKQSQYVRNPNSKEEALKKVRPDKSTYLVANLQIKTKAKEYERNKLSSKAALRGESAGKNSLKAIEYSSRIKMMWTKTFGPEKALAGRIVMKKYVHNPNSKKGALMVMAPGRANARIKDLQVNVKMLKPHGNNLHPDAKFAHSLRDNVKQERTFLMTLRLKWAKLFKKNDTQPNAVKEKVRRPRYDPKERDLWKDLYD
ncbi:MAG: hypothetical protein HYR67_05600 [Bacteroidetes bacterium]|nr:hypothetical protein [Bacteroidota bacterium]